MNETVFLTLSGIVASGIFAQWLAWRTNIPAILFLLLLGIVAGPITGILDPDALFGDLLFPMVSLAVAVILFEGSLTLRFAEVRGLSHVIWRLVSVGMLVTWAVASGAAYLFVDLSPGLAALFGALVVVTGPTVIVPLLRSVRPKRAIATILRWEGIVIDPIGALLAVLGLRISGDERTRARRTVDRHLLALCQSSGSGRAPRVHRRSIPRAIAAPPSAA